MFGFGFFDSVFPVLFTVMFVLILGVIIATLVRNVGQWHKNNKSPRLTVQATQQVPETKLRGWGGTEEDEIDPAQLAAALLPQTQPYQIYPGVEPFVHVVLRDVPGRKRRPDGAQHPRPRLRLSRRGRPGKPHLPGHQIFKL